MRKAAMIFIIALLYALTAKLSFSLAAPNTIISPVWPPAGIALAAVLIFGDIALFGIFIGCFVANSHMFLLNGFSFTAILWMLIPAAGSVIQAYVGKIILIKFTGSMNVFQNTRSVLIFILAAAFGSCLINASFSIPFLLLANKLSLADAPYHWLRWWIADAVGIVAITSTIIAWSTDWKTRISKKQVMKLVITWLFILITGYFTVSSKIAIAYLYIPFAIWAAFQFDIRFSLLTGLLISAICLYDSIYTSYYIVSLTPLNTSISLMQLFITVVYLTILLINAILSDRQRAYKDNLQLLNIQLEKLVLDRTNDLFESNKQLGNSKKQSC